MQYWVKIVFVDNQELLVKDAVRHTISDDMEVLGLLSRDNHASVRLYQGAESLFRSQEHGYRAMALFRRAGGQLPASSGVCGSLALAQGSVQRALLDLSSESLPVSLVERATRWRETADDWVIVVAAMITDYQCP